VAVRRPASFSHAQSPAISAVRSETHLVHLVVVRHSMMPALTVIAVAMSQSEQIRNFRTERLKKLNLSCPRNRVESN
jgi:hypothetical protein